MAYSATHRFARISPRKVRPVADLIRGRLADEALDILNYQPNRGARLLEKVLRSALGNAENPDNPANRGRSIDLRRLYVSGVTVDGGPSFKRLRPRARGMAFVVEKKMSHIRVILEEL